MEGTTQEAVSREVEIQRLFDEHQHLARIHAGLAVKNNTRLAPWIQEIDQAALLGLWDACKKFDPAQDIKFDSYAAHRIRGEIGDWHRNKFGRLGMPCRQLRFDQAHLSLSTPIHISGHRHAELSDLVPAPTRGDTLETRESVNKLLSTLNENARKSMEHYYLDELTMNETAQCIGLSESRVSQILAQTLQQLKEDFKEQP